MSKLKTIKNTTIFFLLGILLGDFIIGFTKSYLGLTHTPRGYTYSVDALLESVIFVIGIGLWLCTRHKVWTFVPFIILIFISEIIITDAIEYFFMIDLDSILLLDYRPYQSISDFPFRV